MAALHKSYTEGEQKPPTSSFRWIREWSRKHNWMERIAEREKAIAEAQYDAIKKRAIESGYAYWPKRVRDLVDLAELLWDELRTEDKRWLPDVKQIGGGEFAERVDIVRFNSPLVQQFRRTLEDIAAEMGERPKAMQLSGPDGGPIEVKDIEAVREKRWEGIAGMMPEVVAAESEDPDEGSQDA